MSKRYFPWDDIPEEDVFPDGMNGIFTVESMEESESNAGKLQFITKFRCVEPAKYKGMTHTEWYTVGDNDNPDDIVPSTYGARDLQKLRIACQIGKEIREVSQFVAYMNSTKPPVGLFITQRLDDNDRVRNSVGYAGYWKVGTRIPGIVENNAKQRPMKKAVVGKPEMGKPNPAPTPIDKRQVHRMNRPPLPGQGSSMPAPPPHDEPPVEAYADTPAEPKAESFKTVRCDSCKEMIPLKEFSQHLAKCTAAKQAEVYTSTDDDEIPF
jgi:hypothetical protein